MKKRSMIHWFCLSGIFSLLFYLLHDVIGGLFYPDYNRFSQAVSDLTASNAPSYTIAHGLSTTYALFACTCCILVCILVQDKINKIMRLGIYLFTAMNWVSGIGYSLYPLSDSGYSGTFQDIMHTFVVTGLVVLLSILSLILIIIGGLKSNEYKSLAICATVALTCMFIGAIGSGIVPKAYFGVIERFSTYSAVVFTAVLGFYGFNNIQSHSIGSTERQ